MKFLIKLISFILVCIMLLSSLASCGASVVKDSSKKDSNTETESKEDSETDSESDDTDSEEYSNNEDTDLETQESIEDNTDGTEDTETTDDFGSTTQDPDFPDKSFPLLQNNQYKIKLIIPDKATSAEKLVASELKTALKSKTGVSILTETDYVVESSDSYDPNAYEILVGNTSRRESTSTYKNLSYNSYGIRIIANKIIFYFSTDAEGSQLVSQFKSKIQSNTSGQYWIANSFSVAIVAEPELSILPTYPNGTITTRNCYDDTKMIVSKNTSLDKFNEYCNTLKSKGFKEYSTRENVDGNYFRIYTKNNTAVNAYFSTGRKQARIIVGPLKDIPSKEKDTTKEIRTPTLTMIGPSESTGNGLALIYHLANSKFLIIDGGYNLSDRVYKELRELQPTGEIIVAGWFVSHPHIDHQENLEIFLKQHAHEIKIEGIYFNYIEPEYYDKLTSPDHQDPSNKEGHSVTRLRQLIQKYVSLDTKIIKPHTGQIYTFGSASVEIIYTIEDFLPTQLDNVNTSSLIVRVNVGGTSTMVLADATKGAKNIVLSMYNNHLKSDIVTLAHHGVWVDTPEMYTKIAAKVLLWPCNTAGAKDFYHGITTSYSKATIREALNQATDVYLAGGVDKKFTLPYKTVGNKQNFIDTVLNG